MSRWIRFVFAVLVLALPTLAQRPDPRTLQDLNQKAIDALAAKRYDEGIGYLQKMLELQPEKSLAKGTAYNLACAYALKGEADKGFEWLEKGTEWGWGTGEGTIVGGTGRLSEIDMCKQDPDLELLRKDARFEPLLAKMAANAEKHKAVVAKGDAYSAQPAVYVPAALKDAAELPLLVVVHDANATKDQVVAGFWKDVADELGFALVAPSAKFVAGEDPAKGMLWYENVNTYADPKESWKHEKPIHDAVAAFKKDHKLDKTRVALVGDGEMGTILAFGAGTGSPGLYKAVLGVDGVFYPQLVATKLANAGKLGQKAELLLDEAKLAKGEEGPAKDDEARRNAITKMLGDASLGGIKTYKPEADAKKRAKLVADEVRALLAASAAAMPKPAEAGAPAPK